MKTVTKSRKTWEQQYAEKLIDCPAHPGEHKAMLHLHGHSQHPGVWECPVTGESDKHDCDEADDFYMDVAVQDHLGVNGHYQTEHPIQVCGVCEMVDENWEPEEPDYE